MERTSNILKSKELGQSSIGVFLVELISLFLLVGTIYFGVKGVLVLGFRTTSPMMGVSSGSMYHHDNSWKNFYLNENYDPSEFPFQNGLQEGDLVLVEGVNSYEDIEIGDVIIWQKGQSKRIIHRVIEIDENSDYIVTHGDNNPPNAVETGIRLEDVIGKAVYSVPYLGYPSLMV